MSRSSKKRPSVTSMESMDAAGERNSQTKDPLPSPKTHRRSGQSRKSVVFDQELAEEQSRVVKELQKELQDVKYENSELKFLLHVALKHFDTDVREKPPDDQLQGMLEGLARDYLENSTRVKAAQTQLEATNALLEEARWVQQHYEDRLRDQDLTIENLQKQVREFKNREILFMQQLPPTEIRTSRTAHHPNESPSRRRKQTGRQRSLSTTGQHRCLPHLRGAALPENYKDAVATLPPILSSKSRATEEVSLWIHHRVKKVK